MNTLLMIGFTFNLQFYTFGSDYSLMSLFIYIINKCVDMFSDEYVEKYKRFIRVYT